MPSRTYNLAKSSDDSAKSKKKIGLSKKLYDDADDIYDEDDEDDGGSVIGLIIIIFLAILIFTAVGYFASVFVLDFGHGAKDSYDLASKIVSSTDDFSYAKIVDYVPQSIRNQGYLSDSDDFSKWRDLDFALDYSLKDMAVDDAITLDTIDVLSHNLSRTYPGAFWIMNITDAELRHCTAVFESETDSITVDINVIAIKIGFKWYFYTGPDVILDGQTISFFALPDNMESDDNDITDSKYTISYPQQADDVFEDMDSEDLPELDFYEDATLDLISGKVSIDDVEYVMPVLMTDINDVLIFDTTHANYSASTSLMPNEAIKNYPVVFANDAYADNYIYASIGNLTETTQNISDCTLTTLCLGKQDELPDISLPGNITFGVSLNDVINMYKGLHVVDSDDDYAGVLADTVYAVTLENSHNKIYFGFSNNKLVEIQWYFIDMTNYKEI